METARQHKVSEQTLYTWRKRFTGMDKPQVAELKRLQQENARLKKLVAERDLEIEVMKEITATKYRAGRRGWRPYGTRQRAACACWLLQASRSMVAYAHRQPAKDAALAEAIGKVAQQHPPRGYRLVTAWLVNQGWPASRNRIRRLWQREGYAALCRRKVLENEWMLILGGLASLIFGMLLLAFPGAGALAIIWLIGAYAIIFGILLLLLAFRLRSLPARLAARF